METRSLNLPVTLPEGAARLDCIVRLQNGLIQIKGVSEASVNNAHDQLRLVFAPDLVTLSRLAREAERLGAVLNAPLDRATFALEGVSSPAHGRALARRVETLPGVLWAGVGFAAAQMQVEYARGKVSEAAILRCLARQGVAARSASAASGPASVPPSGGVSSRATPPAAGSRETSDALQMSLSLRRGEVLAAFALTLLGFLAGFLPPAFNSLTVSHVFYGAALAVGGWRMARAALTGLLARALDPQAPILLAAVGAAGWGRWGEGALVIALFGAGQMALDACLAPGRARLQNLETLEIETSLDAPIAARLGQILNEAQAQQAPAESDIGQFSRKYAGLVCGLAVGAACLPLLLAAGDYHWYLAGGVSRGLAVLLLASPLAFGMAAPIAFASALGVAARRGLAVKGGAVLQTLGAAKGLVYDKTGTLTEGRLTVADVVPLSSLTGAQILQTAVALEADSTHPFAQALRTAALPYGTPLTPPTIAERTETLGLGVRALLNGTPTLLGSPRYLADAHSTFSRLVQEKMAEAEAQGWTIVLLGDAKSLHGLIGLTDTPRPEAPGVVAALHRQGVVYQAMLSGDNAQAAGRVASFAGLSECESGLTPTEKAAHIGLLQHRYGLVAMAGNGAQETEALSRADAGIALGAGRNLAALENADALWLRDRLTELPFLFRLSRRATGAVWQNFVLALGGMAGLIALALTVAPPLPLIALGLIGLNLLITVSGLRLAKDPTPARTKAPSEATPALMTATENALLELVIINDSSADEQPQPGFQYPRWERIVVPFSGEPIRFGRKVATSTLALQIEDEGMSRLHGEIRLEGRRPVVVDLRSTNGIRRNSSAPGAMIAPERPQPLRFGDMLYIGRNTRIEVRPPGESATMPAAPGFDAPPAAPQEAGAAGIGGALNGVNGAEETGEARPNGGTQSLRGKSGVPNSYRPR